MQCPRCGRKVKSRPRPDAAALEVRLWVKYQQITSDLELVKLTTRVDHPIVLDNGWKLNTRISQGFFFSDLPGPENRNGNTDDGFGDLLTQAFFILPSKGKTSFGFGLRAIFPVATQDQFGTGKYTLCRSVSSRIFLIGSPRVALLVWVCAMNSASVEITLAMIFLNYNSYRSSTSSCRATRLSVSSQSSAVTGKTSTILHFRSTSKSGALSATAKSHLCASKSR
jgi:hypothetical protein